MAKKKFLLLSLEDAQSKKVADAVANKSARRILEYLAEQDATESVIAKDLGIALSTVHYNLQQLMKAGLVDVDEFHYSEKGREVNHYRLANQYIVIAPKKDAGLRQKLKALLPVVGIVAVFSGGIMAVQQFLSGARTALAPQAVMMDAMDDAEFVEESVEYAGEEAVVDFATTAKTSAESAIETVSVASDSVEPSIWAVLFDSVAFWFFVGAIFALLVWLFWYWYSNRE